MKKLLVLLITIGIAESFQPVSGQKIIPKFIRRMYFDKDTGRHSSFILVPAIASAPETGLEIGGAGLYSFYSDTTNRQTRVSSVFGYGTITTKGQNKLSITTSYWTPQNKLHYTATLAFYNFPANFYGIGNNTRKADAEHIGERRYKAALQTEKLLGNHIYAGFVAGALKHEYNDANPTSIFNTSPLVEDRNGGSIIYAGPSFTFDSRNNNTYTTEGMIITAYFNAMHGIFGNNGYTGGFFNIEYSQFFALNKKFVLGLDVQEQSLVGGRSPFYLLPQFGSDEMMRGYYGGRYRDRNFIAGQAELRYRISQRFGAAGFIGTGEVFHTAFSAAQLKPNYGAGLRYFFDVEKGLSMRLDYGAGQKPTGEKRESGFYIALGQSF